MTHPGSRIGHSKLGMASFALSSVSGLVLAGYFALAELVVRRQLTRGDLPPDDGAGYAVLGVLLASAVLVLELLALGLGVAGVLQRRRGRSLAILGAVCSVAVLAWIGGEVGFVDVAAVWEGPAEGPSKVRVVPPGSE